MPELYVNIIAALDSISRVALYEATYLLCFIPRSIYCETECYILLFCKKEIEIFNYYWYTENILVG